MSFLGVVLALFIVVVLVYIGIVVFIRYKVGKARICTSKASLNGKTVIVTGANSGIGLEAAKDFAIRGARVIMACRSRQRAAPAVEEVKAACGHENIVFEELDLESYQSIYSFAGRIIRQEKRIDILVNNAGLNVGPLKKTAQGIDATFSINHLGPFLLTHLLLDLIKASAPSRIVNVSSVMHRTNFPGKNGIKFDKVDGQYKYLKSYGTSKLANILHANELARRLQDTGVTANSLHPGGVATGIWSNLEDFLPGFIASFARWTITLAMWTPFEGAQTTIYLAVDETVEGVTGKYFDNCKEKTPSKHALNEQMAAELWDVSMELTGQAKKE